VLLQHCVLTCLSVGMRGGSKQLFSLWKDRWIRVCGEISGRWMEN